MEILKILNSLIYILEQKRKLSDLLGSQWSKDELEHFYGAYRKYGKDWKKVPIFVIDFQFALLWMFLFELFVSRCAAIYFSVTASCDVSSSFHFLFPFFCPTFIWQVAY